MCPRPWLGPSREGEWSWGSLPAMMGTLLGPFPLGQQPLKGTVLDGILARKAGLTRLSLLHVRPLPFPHTSHHSCPQPRAAASTALRMSSEGSSADGKTDLANGECQLMGLCHTVQRSLLEQMCPAVTQGHAVCWPWRSRGSHPVWSPSPLPTGTGACGCSCLGPLAPCRLALLGMCPAAHWGSGLSTHLLYLSD